MSTAHPKESLQQLEDLVGGVHPKPGHGALLQALGEALPDLELKLVYSRTGWHRPGGIVDSHGNRVADSLATWLTAQGDDVIDLQVQLEGAGLIATRLCGITHYIIAKTGTGPWGFLQIEIDELREVADRELFDADNPPDAVEDLLDPEAPLKVDPTPLGPAFYHLRETWDLSQAHQRMTTGSYAESLLALRFVEEWQKTSAASHDFCGAFVLRLADFKDRFGDMRLQATPLTTHVRALPPFPSATERGVELSRFLTAFDRAVGYSMAWYFHLVSGAQPELESVARAVFEDITGVYDYLPERDMAVLKAWIEDPYMF